jgi:hypothetical protein
MPWTALGDVVSWHQLYLAAKPSHVGVDVDRLAYPLHRPMACYHQTRDQGFLSGTVLSCHVTMVVASFRGMRSPQAWIFDGVLSV